ncbi:MAG: DMT family transporter [Desulfamplus sp.]|nr:DMT family transporter [Desulfamplus sp.]
MNRQNSLLPYISLLFATLIWSSSFVALKIAFQGYHPMVVIFGRMAVGSISFLILAIIFKDILKSRALKQKSLFADIKLILMMVICEPCLYFIFEAKALELTTASQVGMITAIMPLLVSVVAFFVLKEDLTEKILVGLTISVFGACWLSFSGEVEANAPNPPLGNLCEFIAMVCASGYTICLKKLTQRGYSPFFLTALQAFGGAIFYFPMLFLPSTNLPVSFPLLPTLSVVYLGAAVTLGAYALFNFGVSRIAAGQASAFINLIPIFSLILGIVVLNERLNVQQYAACAVIFAGIFLSQHKTKRSEVVAEKAVLTDEAVSIAEPISVAESVIDK